MMYSIGQKYCIIIETKSYINEQKHVLILSSYILLLYYALIS